MTLRPGRHPVTVTITVAVAVALLAGVCGAGPAGAITRTGPDDWLGTLNAARVAAGVDPVTENPAWTAGIAAHLDYLATTDPSFKTGDYASAHTENPAAPAYTADGDAAARSSNLTYGISDPRGAVDSWLAAPFHAIGMLRPGLRTVAFAQRGHDAGLDVIRGYDGRTTTTRPVLWPGPGSTTNITGFRGESPNPLESCTWAPIRPISAGAIALLSGPVAPGVTAQVTGPDGPVPAADTCLVTANNYRTSDPVYGPAGASILASGNAAVVFVDRTWTAGRWTVTLTGTGSGDLNWSFDVVTPPSEPTNVHAQRTATGWRWTWDPPASDGGSPVTGYIATGGDPTTSRTLGPDTRTVELPGDYYGFVVAAVTDWGTAGASVVTPQLTRTPAPKAAGKTRRVCTTRKVRGRRVTTCRTVRA